VALNVALLGSAEVQSVQGLDELTGNGGTDLRWLYPVALLAGAGFVWHQRRVRRAGATALIDAALFRGRNVRVALIVNFVVGAALVIAMVDVPLFVNAVEIDLERSAVIAGWVLSALTAAMALLSYVGGRVTERTWYGPPIVVGLVAATLAYTLMGLTWGGDTPYPVLAVQLALLGGGIGLTIAPTTSAVVDHAEPDSRGAAAAVVMVVRMIGLSVGLSALTAWGLARFNALRSEIELPPITDPTFQSALNEATAQLTAQSIADTFLASAFALGVGLVLCLALLRRSASDVPESAEPLETPMPEEPGPTDEVDTSSADAEDDVDIGEMVPVAGGPLPDDEPLEPDAPLATGDSWVHRNLTAVLVGMTVLLVASFALSVWMFTQVRAANDDLETTQADLARVESGAALYASQVNGFVETVNGIGPSIDEGLDQAVTGLEDFGTSTIEFDVSIDETVSISETFELKRTVEVPINTSIPIDEEVETTVTVNGPFGVDIPVDITVPVNIDVPIDLTVDVPIDESVPIDVDVPVQLDVPISIDVEGTELEALTTSLIEGLRAFQEGLDGLTGN